MAEALEDEKSKLKRMGSTPIAGRADLPARNIHLGQGEGGERTWSVDDPIRIPTPIART